MRAPKTLERRTKTSYAALAEAFLRFSPCLQFREPNLLFLDIARTAHFFRKTSSGRNSGKQSDAPEAGVLECALNLARELGFEAKAAISDTAAGAQAFAHLNLGFICPPGEESERLQSLSLPLLLQLEGLVPWERRREVEQIVSFFSLLGFERIGDLHRFDLNSFQERWGSTGHLLWKRFHALDRVPLSPFLPTEPLTEYVHLEFSVSLLSLLLFRIRRSMTALLARLQGRCLFARRLLLHLRCEYSGQVHKIEVEPSAPCRDLDLLLTLLENKLEGIDLENPVQEYEIEVVTCPERVHQFDFFEPRTTDQDQLASLLSLLTQSQIRVGLYEIHDAILPEQGYLLRTHTSSDDGSACGVSDEKQPFILRAPRPTRLLKTPLRLPIQELQKLHILSAHPIERLEDAWWERDASAQGRDYHFAVSSQGQCLWIYRDTETQDHYLHGYFD